MMSDNISDIDYRSKSCIKRGCCKEKDKIMNKVNRQNKKKVSLARNSSIIDKLGPGNGMGGGAYANANGNRLISNSIMQS